MINGMKHPMLYGFGSLVSHGAKSATASAKQLPTSRAGAWAALVEALAAIWDCETPEVQISAISTGILWDFMGFYGISWDLMVV